MKLNGWFEFTVLSLVLFSRFSDRAYGIKLQFSIHIDQCVVFSYNRVRIVF